nr:MAG TPA: hypothetical protein [Caudoviricetes sp.]
MIEETKGYTLSVDIYKKVKALKMKDPRYYIYASLRGSGMSIRDSWAVAFQGEGFNWPKDTLEREMNKLESLDSVQTRIAEVQGKKAKNESADELSPEELAKATSKEQILTDLVIARRRMKEGTKEWTEQTRLIAEYARIKQDELQTEDSTVHFYLPINYPTGKNDCLLFKNGLCKGGK